jgi:hypothetical protein
VKSREWYINRRKTMGFCMCKECIDKEMESIASIEPVTTKEKYCKCHCHHEFDVDCDCFGTTDQDKCLHCQSEPMKSVDIELFNILNDYGDFFLTDYPNQAETKSIHPTIKRIKTLFSSEMMEIIGEDEELLPEGKNQIDIPYEDNDIISIKNGVLQELRQRVKQKVGDGE